MARSLRPEVVARAEAQAIANSRRMKAVAELAAYAADSYSGGLPRWATVQDAEVQMHDEAQVVEGLTSALLNGSSPSELAEMWQSAIDCGVNVGRLPLTAFLVRGA